jgi:hypothetical protein
MHGGALMAKPNDNQAAAMFTRRWLLLVILCGAVPFLLFALLLNDPGRGRAAAIATMVIMYAVRGRWNLRRYTWFWGVLTSIVAAHVLLVLLVPWTSKSYPGLLLFPVAVLDFAVVWGCFKLAEKLMTRRDTASSTT